MENLIHEALQKKKIYFCDAQVIQKNIDAINFRSPRGKEEALKGCIKHMAKAKRIIELAIREDKRERGLLKPLRTVEVQER